jgi:uncharacterized membrane protein
MFLQFAERHEQHFGVDNIAAECRDIRADHLLLVIPSFLYNLFLMFELFYRYEAITDASIRIYKFLSKLQIPFFALTFALVAIDFMFSFLDYYKGVKDTIPLLVIYLVIQSGFLIFYAITVIQIAKRMQKSAEISGGKKKVSYLLQVRYAPVNLRQLQMSS